MVWEVEYEEAFLAELEAIERATGSSTVDIRREITD
jgi:hypothetical protein